MYIYGKKQEKSKIDNINEEKKEGLRNIFLLHE